MRNVRQRQPERLDRENGGDGDGDNGSISDSFYSISNGGRKGEDGMKPLNFTSFRRAERYFRRYPFLPTEEESFNLVDFSLSNQGLVIVKELDNGLNIYELESSPGTLYIPSYLGKQEQLHWIKKCCFDFLGNENPTSLTAHWDIPLSTSLAKMYKEGTVRWISRIPYIDDSEKLKNSSIEQEFTKERYKSLFRRMRWSTLGYKYNWTTKAYHTPTEEDKPFPAELGDLATAIVSLISSKTYKAEAGIVNQYQPGDTLCGHIDRSEPNMSSPLVSISLGKDCIFVVGGQTRDVKPSGIILRSGDIVLLTGQARKYYHGVPKILNSASDIFDDLSEDARIALDLLGDGRLNINIRQVNN